MGSKILVPTPTVKRVTHSLGAPRTQNAASAVVDWAERIPIQLPVKTKRWRLRVANRVLLPTAAPTPLTQVFTISDVVLGVLTGITAQGRPLASYTDAPVKVLDSFQNPADGSDYVSPWVTDPAMQFGPDSTKTIGLTVAGTNNGNANAVTSSHYGFRRSNAGAAGSLYSLSASGYVGNTLVLDKRIEYEFEGDNPVGLIVGPSGDEGYNLVVALDGLGGYEVVQSHETWPGVMSMRTGVPTINAGITGATQAPFLDPASLAYSRFDLATTPPDFAIVSMGGNSIVTYAVSAATAQTETFTVVNAIRSLGIKRIYLATISAAGLGGADAKEVQRQVYNTWVRNVPLGVTGICDFDVLTRDPANNLQQLPGFVSADNVHPNLGGYQRWGAGVSIR